MSHPISTPATPAVPATIEAPVVAPAPAGQVPTAPVVVPPATPAPATPAPGAQTWTLEQALAELEKVRRDAARYRTERNTERTRAQTLEPLATQMQQLQDAQKTEAEKLREQLAAAQAQAQQAAQEAERAKKESKLTALAARAGVNPQLIALLDISRLDLEDEAGVIALLKQFAGPAVPTGGGPSNPASDATTPTRQTEEQMRKEIFRPGGKTHLIFGGK